MRTHRAVTAGVDAGLVNVGLLTGEFDGRQQLGTHYGELCHRDLNRPVGSATRNGGYVYGRGTLDDKSNLFAAMMTMVLLQRTGAKLDRDVILVEDILDTGLTMTYLKKMLQARQPRALKVAALLDKPSRRKLPLEGDYIGFKIPDEFVVGYGLDYAEKYRNLADICIVPRE